MLAAYGAAAGAAVVVRPVVVKISADALAPANVLQIAMLPGSPDMQAYRGDFPGPPGSASHFLG